MGATVVMAKIIGLGGYRFWRLSFFSIFHLILSDETRFTKCFFIFYLFFYTRRLGDAQPSLPSLPAAEWFLNIPATTLIAST